MAAYVVFMRDRMKDPVEFEKYMAAVPGTLEGHPVRPLAFWNAATNPSAMYSGQLETRR